MSLDCMNIFDNFSWQYFIQSLTGGLGMGVIVSLSICLNIRVQNKYNSTPSSFLNFIQSITYVASAIIGLPAIFYLGLYATDHLNDSPINTVFFIVGILSPIILAFRSGFIPEKSNKI
jgi:formate/nitrite transporter FocA (FNT family)